MERPEFDRKNLTLDEQALAGHVQAMMDETHRELAWVRTFLVAALYSLLTLVNYLTLEGEARTIAMLFSLIVAVSFALFTGFHRQVHYPPRQTNLVTFGEVCVLQADSIAFAIATNDLMNGFAVYIMIVAAGIFMTTARSIIITCLMLILSWTLAVSFRGTLPDFGREAMMLIAAVFGAYFFFIMRKRSATRLGRYQLLEQKYKETLEDALSHIETLSGLLPICASCKSIRVEGNQWTALELYVKERSEIEFTHSVCPTCHEKLYPELHDSSR